MSACFGFFFFLFGLNWGFLGFGGFVGLLVFPGVSVKWKSIRKEQYFLGVKKLAGLICVSVE